MTTNDRELTTVEQANIFDCPRCGVVTLHHGRCPYCGRRPLQEAPPIIGTCIICHERFKTQQILQETCGKSECIIEWDRRKKIISGEITGKEGIINDLQMYAKLYRMFERDYLEQANIMDDSFSLAYKWKAYGFGVAAQDLEKIIERNQKNDTGTN